MLNLNHEKEEEVERLWAPWRSKYILCGNKEKECFLCQKPRENKDEENYILLRGRSCLVMLNVFPYNNGHLLIAPYRHIASVEELSEEERIELMELSSRMVVLLKNILHPQGFNLGMNIGAVAGAGVAGHLHLHIVPRWSGDTNFMPVLSDSKVISESLDDTYRKLKKGLEGMSKDEAFGENS